MGRYYWSKKTESDSLKKIQNWWLKKHGYLEDWGRLGIIKWINSFSGTESSVVIFTLAYGEDRYLRINYTQTDEDKNKKEFDYKIPLTTTKCYFGGYRYWFICPGYVNGVYCGRRVGVLYKDGNYFACRHCYDLSYVSNNQSRNSRFPEWELLFKSDAIAEKKAQIRVKFWKGQPTRRYKRLAEKEELILRRLYMFSPLFKSKWMEK